MKKENIALLLGYLRSQKEVINKILLEIKEKLPYNKENTVYLGYLFHNFYCAFEDLFQEIAKTFENRIEDPSRYHRELLKRMHIEVPGIRPFLLSEESYRIMDELRGFRHIFRHSYDYELSPKKIEDLKELLLKRWEIIDKDLTIFGEFLEKALF
ncbi:MAG: hypothetical protein HYS70_05545 [Nitrospinae bacterium]|nr:hypothetical protein [Nitrospinota bacterium]